MIKKVFIEKSTLFVGESLKIKNYSGKTLKLKLYVITISDLLKKEEEKRFPEYRIIFSYFIEKDLVEGETEIKYPETFPPTVSTKHFKTRCSLIIGYPRFGDKILFPRTEIRLKILPVYKIEKEENGINKGELLVNKLYCEPDGEITCKLMNSTENVTTGILVREWIREQEEKFDEYVICEGDMIKNNEFIIKLPHDFTRVEDPFLFYPYSFYSMTPKNEFGIKAYIFAQYKEAFIKREIAIIPRKPQFKRIIQ
ncbi:MAG: hypothetical protein QXO33_01445 [Nitrososphaeria archaeon]